MKRIEWRSIFPWGRKKCWIYFSDPFEVPGVAMANFLSYQSVNAPGFKKREALTTVIDLADDIEAIYGRMRKNFIRKQIKRGERNGIIVKCDDNFKGFGEVYRAFRAAKRIGQDRYQAFLKAGILFSAYYDHRLVASGLFIADEKNVRAWALSSRRHTVGGSLREIIGQANRMIIWEAIKFAKATGRDRLDLGGIAPEANDREERSLAEFKEAFGGQRRNSYYYHKIYSPWLRVWIKWREKII
jgi:hypothetical protein